MDYKFQIEFLRGKNNVVADCLSRMPVEMEEREEEDTIVQEIGEVLGSVAVSVKEWELARREDLIMEEMEKRVVRGRKVEDGLNDGFSSYFRVRDQLSLQGGKLMRREQLIPPVGVRNHIISIVHEGHLGRVMMKRKVRQFFWWPGMDREVEEIVSNCMACANSDKTKVVRQPPLRTVPFPSKPWEKLAIDFIGPIIRLGERSKYIIVLVDYHSERFLIKAVGQVTTLSVIEFFEEAFVEEGMPKTIVSVNGVQFVSKEMTDYLARMGITHERIALFRPQANGLVERVNRIVMENIQLSQANHLPWMRQLKKMICAHRTTPHSVTRVSPFVSLKGREPGVKECPIWLRERKRVTVDRELVKKRVEKKQRETALYYNRRMGVKQCHIRVGDWVVIKKGSIVQKGESKYSIPHKVKETKHNVVVLENGLMWSLGNICKINH
ncbi:gamma-glutamylaminecyclotransferase isoform X1 [Pleurodeles waltl]|uniref:gamma-glutamylaminecyclotransferase isoform X1 n=1 Tax=Pleurodeles waltl TaxID=8319 RepID=UPI0037096C3C